MSMLALILCVPAFVCLALAMERHQRLVFGAALSRVAARTLRVTGWLGLVVALGLAVAAQGWALGLVWYSGCTSLAAGVVYALLIVYERRATARQ
ncbi:DUF3325 domain-containing protein [Paraburkholderia acidisoli]|uniref:DUF3325 family protein n=1 Tax=Paraburkholderia acidisoli TaxID=2571748 RepID=A0A7Z2GPW9_9BURK|nr:DUF3325 domain-containing protein [Paraburkholderia acidisoli]QGZ65760.1 DUF3325 family protein [Paraburkholderia acidisoli]